MTLDEAIEQIKQEDEENRIIIERAERLASNRNFIIAIDEAESKFKRTLALLYDIPNAIRVLEIMDNVGCDIEPVPDSKYWRIKPKWYVTKEEADDLQKIILFNEQYRKRSKIWNLIFRRYHRYSRIHKDWF